MERYKSSVQYREGTTQTERYPKALSPDYVRIDERSPIDLIRQSAAYAEYVKYYSGKDTVDGNWKEFFCEIYDFENKKFRFTSIEELEEKASVSPPIALFLAFLRLFGIAQDNLNNLKEKHLDFYYREILRIQPREALPDFVPLFFEPNKSVQQAIVPAGTVFDAGKDALGKSLLYATKNDLVVNHAKIGSIRGIYNQSHNLLIADDMLNHCFSDIKTEDHFLGVHCDTYARLGVAIASPLFDLPDGKREIQLEIDNKNFDINWIDAEYTSEKGWENGEIILIPGNKFNKSIEIKITIDEEKPPIAKYDEIIHAAGINAEHPVIRLLLKQPVNQSIADINTTIKTIKTNVAGSKALKLSNKYGKININKPFIPFGMQLNAGGLMEIDNPAIFNQYLDDFTINVEWKDDNPAFPKSFSYSEKTDDSRTAYANRWIPKNYVNLSPVANHFSLTLMNDLGHSTYPERYAKAAIDMAKDVPDTEFPPKPDIPEITNLSIDYCTNSGSLKNDSMNQHTFYHFHPFGWQKAPVFDLFPEVMNSEGALLFGINGMNKPGILSLYLQLSEYGANFEKEIKPDTIPIWYYLNGDVWKEFKKEEILLNSTSGFSKSGMVYFDIPPDAFLEHTIMPADTVLWLRLLFIKDSDAFPVLEAADTQAVEALFADAGNELSHLEKGLPAGTISKPQRIIPGIRSVKQTYPSAGGRAPEATVTFQTRVSEQLRHKGRAWNIWDYERLILEQFPSIYKVKCIPYGDEDGYQPGSILIMLLPDCRIIHQKDNLKPVVTLAMINEVTEFIKARCSPFVLLKVTNPVYERILITCSVEFRKGYDKSFYSNELNEDLKRFLSPWTDTTGEMAFNKTLTNAQIIYFIEKRPYIDHIRSLSVSIGDKRIIDDREILQPSSPFAMLTSADSHSIIIQ